MAAAAEPKAKPNVVIIVADELGARDLGCTGSTYYKTPNLDAFAKRGVKLDEAYSNWQDDLILLFTLHSGLTPERFFKSSISDERSLFGMKPLEKLLPPRHQLKLGNILIDILRGQSPPAFAAAKYTNITHAGDAEGLKEKLKSTTDTPFFATIIIRTVPPNGEALANYKTGKAGSQGDPRYAARVEQLDRRVGEILKALEDARVSDNTFIVFTSAGSGNCIDWDTKHATTSNAPYRDGQGYLYEGGLRVPFLIRGPGVKAGGFPISAADILPTLVSLCGIETDAKYDGVDLGAQFLGTAKPDPNRALHWHCPHYTPQYGRPGGAIRVGNDKLIEYFEDGRRELFDLGKDVGESKNLAAEKPELVKELAAKLAAWRKEVGAQMPVPNPDYKPNPQAEDGSITLHARTAFVTGVQLRFEPAPHKNTLGYWTNATDTASFDFTVTKPGTFTVHALQGAGKGSGGAEVELAVGESNAKFTVKDTGGFQQFEKRKVGELTIAKAGRHTLTVTPKSKPGVAVMDLREVTLNPKSNK